MSSAKRNVTVKRWFKSKLFLSRFQSYIPYFFKEFIAEDKAQPAWFNYGVETMWSLNIHTGL